MYKILIFLGAIAFSGICSADSQWVFYCPTLKVFCTEANHELKISNAGSNKKYTGLAYLESKSWSSEVSLEGKSILRVKVKEAFCKNTYIYISFRESTNTECKYIINEL
jgi:hypothetical protein